MNSFKCSIIICTYQRPKEVETLLHTIQQQTITPYEIWVIDASTDALTEAFCSEVDDVSYYKAADHERGLTKQRNVGIQKVAKDTDIVCFLDDDTLLSTTYLEELIKAYQTHPEAIGVGGYISNEVVWEPYTGNCSAAYFCMDGFRRKESVRYRLRAWLGVGPETPPGKFSACSHSRSIGYLPPSGKVYSVDFFMGGVASYKKTLFESVQFSTYFEGYGLYEDFDFCLRASKFGPLYVTTKAQLAHHHAPSGRPNQFKYGKMVVRNGWYVWRLGNPTPTFKATIKWHAIEILLWVVRFGNVLTGPNRIQALTEVVGRKIGWWSIVLTPPKQH